MFSKRKGFSWVALLIVIIVIGILAGGMMLPVGGPMDHGPASTLISQLRNAKAGGIMFLGDNTDLTLADMLSIWPTLNAAGSSYDQYMDNVDKVRQLVFVVVPNVPPDNITWLMIGKKVRDPIVAGKIIGMAGGALYNAIGGAFTRSDDLAFMRVK